jgi:hypothetical protein
MWLTMSAGVVAFLLGGGELAVEAAEEVDEGGEVLEVGFGVFGAGEFVEEDLGEAGGGGLEADFGEVRGARERAGVNDGGSARRQSGE